MYENYLLHTGAIAAVANEIEGFRSPPVSPEDVETLIEEKRSDPKLFCQSGAAEGKDWVTHIDGAKLLEKIFTTLSEARVTFGKVEHSVAITEWLLSHASETLEEIGNLIAETLTSGGPGV